VERALDQVSGSFSFQAASDYKQPFPVPRGQAVKVFVNSTQVMTGFVDKITVSYDGTQHSITVEGRDKTADIVDSKVDHKIEFQAPITLEDVATQTLSSIGASDVQVINNVKGGIDPFVKGELISANIGQSAFEFIDQYAKKRQVVLTTDGKGNLVFERASTESTNIQLNNIVGGNSNTIKTGQVEYDDSERYGNYTFYSQGNPAGDKTASESSKQLTTRTGIFTDSEVRSSRKYHEIAEASSKDEPLEKRAKWEGLIRKAKSVKYTCNVVGHSATDSGPAYKPNTLVLVNDDFSDMHQELLIIKVTYRLSMGEGSTTELELLSREAFAILQDTNSKKDSSVSGLKTKGKIKFEQHSTQSGAFQSEYVNYSTKPK
jgi:prophage tail gpP-like protein